LKEIAIEYTSVAKKIQDFPSTAVAEIQEKIYISGYPNECIHRRQDLVAEHPNRVAAIHQMPFDIIWMIKTVTQ
jgi:hypothetical protein